LNLPGRWRSARVQLSLPNVIISLAILGILVFAGVAAVQRHYLSEDTGIFLACFVPAVILHEVSHGVVALWCGDDTAKRAGRVTLNPLRHIDPFGSIILPIVLTLTAGFPFGYAKPVPVNIGRLRHPRNQAVLVGLAGPATNIVLACIGGVALHLLHTGLFVHGGGLYTSTPAPLSVGDLFALYFGVVNILLAVFNLIPIPPLDGSALLERLLPASMLPQYYRMRFAFIIVVLVVVLYAHGPVTSVFDHFENWYVQIFA
jgi:Zn-dependent protease